MATILMADDDLLLTALALRALTAHGHVVRVAADGGAALAEVRRSKPDLLLLDSIMPVLTGGEVLKALREQSSTALLPVIMLTATAEETAMVSAFEGGALDYITKPFRIDDLLARVAATLQFASEIAPILNSYLDASGQGRGVEISSRSR